MTEITNTRAALRQALCHELQMPFMRRVGSHSHPAASPVPTTTSISDSLLVQSEDIWTGQWFYNITKNECRKIVQYFPDSKEIKFEYAATLPVVGDEYEIHSIWNAFELHNAINRAIEDAFPSFFDYVTDETLILKEETLKYDISGLSSIPWLVAKVWVEHSEGKISGSVSSATASTLVDSTAPFSAIAAGYYVSIYAGTGAGQLRTVSTASSTTLGVSVNWTTNPDTTSKYMVWDPNEQTLQWEQVLSATFDQKEWPNYLYFTKAFPNSVGLRIRLEYTSRPAPLTTETGTTVVPKEFIINKALSILFGQKVSDNRVDRNRYANLEEYRRQLAEQYRLARAFQMPDLTIWKPSESLITRNNPSSYVNPF